MHKKWLMGLLMDEAGADGAAGGGGTGTGDGGGTPPLTLEAITTLLNNALNGLDQKIEAKLKALKPAAAATGTGSGTGAGTGTGTGTGAGTGAAAAAGGDPFAVEKQREHDERLAKLEADAKVAQEKAEARELDAEIKSALSGFTWAADADKTIPFDLYKSKAKRNDEGQLVIDNNGQQFALGKYIAEHVPRGFKNMLAARNIGGSGAEGKPNHQGTGGADIDAIKPGMTADADAAVRQGILNALKNR